MRLGQSIAAGLCTAALFFAAIGATANPPPAPPAAAGSPKKPTINITISKETTRITEPLTKEGYPDYLEWLNRKYSQGVTPENNAVVLLFQVVGPHEVSETIRPEFFRRLGVPVPPMAGDYLIDVDDFIRKQRGNLTNDEEKQLIEQQYEARRRPWTEKEFPQFAQWLKKNEKALAVAVEMTQRPKYYAPLISSAKSFRMIQAMLPAFTPSRMIARALVARAMFRLGKHDVAGCWHDLIAVQRLGRLLSSGGSTLMECLVALNVSGTIREPLASLVHDGRLTELQATMFRRQLDESAPRISIADSLDEAERFVILDVACCLARDGTGPLAEMGGFDANTATAVSLALDSLIDWNVVLRLSNRAFDHLAAALRMSDPEKRRVAVRKIDEKLRSIGSKSKDWFLFSWAMAIVSRKSREPISNCVGGIMLSFMMPAFESTLVVENRLATESRMNDLVLALGGFRSDHRRYPDRLDELAPRYLPAIPRDAYTAAEFRFERTKDGFRLYSLGANGIDDDGRGENDQQPGDDDLIQVPLPKAK